ncbi:MAG TPA: hypothetical protein VNL16_09510 [Chloroflexota bacterium]|nr:hypothetical protein [Chloroflexota bacterium]
MATEPDQPDDDARPDEPARRPTIWDNFRNAEESWRSFLIDAGFVAYARIPPEQRERPRKQLDGILREWDLDEKLFIRADDLVGDLVVELLQTGFLIGYALARTWPRGPEDLDGWPDAAILYAGLARREPGTDDKES